MGYRIVAIGGDDRSGAPEAYLAAVRALLAELSGPAWLAWWEPAEYGVLEVWYDLDAQSARSTVTRRDDGVVVATARRPRADIPSAPGTEAAARRLAYRDISRLMSAVGVRMWLDDPPPLPSPAELATLAEAAAARTADRHERMELLLRCLRDRLGDDAEGLLRLLDAGGGDAVVDVLSVRVVTGDLVLTAREAVELHALAAGR